MTNSAIYVGEIRHRRFEPKSHSFTYPLFMLYLDLDELDLLFQNKWFASIESVNFVSFKRQDYFAPGEPNLKTAVINEVESTLGCKGRIARVKALLHLRYLNFTFNPVVFYYCYDQDGDVLAILAEITNTPWGERHHYVLPIKHSNTEQSPTDILHTVRGKGKHQFSFNKAFHVSPFNPMDMTYRWVFSEPSESLHVHMDNLMSSGCKQQDASVKHFDATLSMRRLNFDENLGKILIQYPFMTVKVVSGIYWQALKLWLKKSPFYDHPANRVN